MVESEARQQAAIFPRGILRGKTPLSLWGGDTLIYRAIVVLAAVALPVVALAHWLVRGSLPWPQLAITATFLAGSLVCLGIARRGLREVAAMILIGLMWLAVTIYAFATGYGLHSGMVYVYLPCLLYTALFFGIVIAGAELALTLAVLILMYVAEANGQLRGAAGIIADGQNFNHFLSVVVTCLGTMVGGIVYHRRVEREAARVLEEGARRRLAMEEAQRALAQTETAQARLAARSAELEAGDASARLEISRLQRTLALLGEAIAGGVPAGPLADLAGCATRALRPEPVDLSALARRAAERARAAGARATIDVDAGMHAPGDREMIESLLRRLIERACLACAGEPQPMVHVGSGSLEGKAVFFVRDNEPPRQEAAAPDLAVLHARCVAERHGGDLEVRRGPGHETTVFFSLPA